jgi:ATP/maltotriose-dependent transcriptional regulator MalT/DNA-binding SARP family transcriptional activator
MIFPEILQTKITPPKPSSRALYRPRVSKHLLDSIDYRLTLLQASAGYGKSTALAFFTEKDCREAAVIWYQITEDDNNAPIFLLYLLQATRQALPELTSLPLSSLRNWDSTQGALPTKNIVHQYLNDINEVKHPVLIILDDIHFALDTSDIAFILDRLISLAPPNLHILLSSRQPVKLPNLFRWRSQGDILTLDQGLLTFTPEEITRLFEDQYQYELPPQEVADLYDVTEGWAVALHVIWQSLRSGAVSSLEAALTYQASTMENLFSILMHEVLDQQPDDIQKFLYATAILRNMTPQACDAVRQKNDSSALLAYLKRQDLFVVNQGNGTLRYQHIFHHLLRQQVEEEQGYLWHSRASRYYSAQGDTESAIYHAIQAQDYDQAALLLSEYGGKLLRAGRLDTLGGHLDDLPPEMLLSHPMLLKYLGDLARLRSQFQESLGWYQQAEAIWRDRSQPAEVGRALRGQARVYLDTVNPSQASELLQQALRLCDRIDDRRANARLYELLAENKLNAGKPQEAEEFRQKAEALLREGPAESELLYRVLLRTGQLQEAQVKLEQRAQEEREQPVCTPRAHRETLLVLSLIYAFQGKASQAYQAALEGTQRGTELDSPFVIAVGHIRQGHALMLLQGENNLEQARQEYEKAVEISRSLDIPRLRVEAYWGLCRVFGYQGDIEQASQIAQKGIGIALQAGDEWVASLIRLTMGASLVQIGRYEAAHIWLQDAQRGFQECSDPFGSTTTRLWRCISWHQQDNQERLGQELPKVLTSCQEHQYSFLFTKPTLLGPPQERRTIPLLILARDQGWDSSYSSHLLQELGVPEILLHPGYQLRVHSLGTFQVWRGSESIPSNGWQRTKSRRLFQLFLTYRHTPLDREQIYEHLWPGANPERTERNFKVALSTLYRVLEPDRAPGSESAYIGRDESLYYLRPEADLWLDMEAFSRAVQQAEALLPQTPAEAIPVLENALQLYQGDYLPDARYETWAAGERENLSVLYLRAADQLCALYLQEHQPKKTIDLCQQIFVEDNCWERAYRHLMLAYHQMGDHGQVARTYQRCVQILRDELDISPSPETVNHFQDLTSQSQG